MGAQLIVTVVTRGDELEQHVPGGFRYVDQMFEEAGLRDSLSASQTQDIGQRLRILSRALRREFGNRVGIRILNPWTPNGLWFIVRHRLRDIPCVVVAGQRFAVETPISELVEAVRNALQ